MPFTFFSRSLRQILPRVELRERDRRPGAYPVKSKTGDRTRTGRNKIYFDDARTVLFRTGVSVTYPTTQQFDPNWVGRDLTSSLGSVVGNVDPYAVEQFIIPARQIERAGPFFDTGLYEQDETNVVNSKLMTGVAYGISPDKFRSKISDKTIIRLEKTIAQNITLHASQSAMHYYNSKNGVFDQIIVDDMFASLPSPTNYEFLNVPWSFDRVLFTPYGFTHTPIDSDVTIEGSALENYFSFFGSSVDATKKSLLQKISNYIPDGNSVWTTENFNATYGVSSSLLNPNHAATKDQTLVLSGVLSNPFLLEKAVLELQIEAGAGWLNDSFSMHIEANGDLTPWQCKTVGGPAITFGLLRQDRTDARHRDLIASGAITNAWDVSTSSFVSDQYTVTIFSTSVYMRSPLLGDQSVNTVIHGTSLHGSDNTFTGSLRLILEPAITQHIVRSRMSGTVLLNDPYPLFGGDGATGFLCFSSNTRRPGRIETSRDILGNQLTMLTEKEAFTSAVPVLAPITDPGSNVGQLTLDIVSKTRKTPYLLYPEDELIVCINKCRPGRSSEYAHDVKIVSGTMRLTLYGDLIKEDVEFHDTLNQRLETEEIWQDVGEDPVLDQFDVAYRSELSGSYVDRFTVANMLASYGTTDLSSSVQLTSYYSHFSSKLDDQTSWSTQYGWSTARMVEVLKKNNRNVNHISLNEKFWDSRIPDPLECIKTCNPNYRLLGLDTSLNTISFVLYTGDAAFAHDVSPTETGRGIKDWMMTYPYDQRYQGLTQKFSNTLTRDFMIRKDPGSAGTFGGMTPYKALSLEIGHSGSNGIHRRVCAENDTNFSLGHIGLTTSEFIKAFYGIGDGKSNVDNQHVTFRRGVSGMSQSVVIRGWRHGMMSAFPLRPRAVYRRDHFGQPRDLLEQRLDAKFFDELGLSPDGSSNGVVGVKTGPVQVYFYDSAGKQTDALKTLSSNVSFEATSSVPYFDGSFRNRPAYDFSTLNIKSVII